MCINGNYFENQSLNQTAMTSVTSSINLREVFALAAILLVAEVNRIPGLTESLWFDEIWYTLTTFAKPDMMAVLVTIPTFEYSYYQRHFTNSA
jgi:hypothetical protein